MSYDKFSEPSLGPRIEEKSNVLDQNRTKSKGCNGGTRWKRDEIKTIYLYYSSTEIKVKRSELLVTFSSFVSAVGGNLGIFIGFSFLGFFTKFHDMIKKLLHWELIIRMKMIQLSKSKKIGLLEWIFQHTVSINTWPFSH